MPIHFEQIPATRLLELPRDKTVFFFPVGPLEDHGPHLPMGLDLYEADALSLIAAERLEAEMPGWAGVIMPRTPLGIQANTGAVKVTVKGYVLRDWLVDSCHSLHRIGFRNFVCFSGNLSPRQLTAIEEASRILRRKAGGIWPLRWLVSKNLPKLVSASSALVDFKKVLDSPIWPDPAEHGGERDTSVALRCVPQLVNPEFARLPEQPRISQHRARMLRRLRGSLSGYWGNPAGASRERGTRILGDTVDQVFLKLRAVWEGANPEGLFRSWYSVLPPNRSFFKAWALFVALMALMLAWVYVSFQALLSS